MSDTKTAIRKNDEVLEGKFVEEVQAEVASEAHVNFVCNLRAFADFWERNPSLALPSETTFNLWPDAADLPKIARAFGKCDKSTIGDAYFMLVKTFGTLIKIEANWRRDSVCERVVVGRETVTEKVPVSYEERVVERDKVEWHCPKVMRPRIGKAAS